MLAKLAGPLHELGGDQKAAQNEKDGDPVLAGRTPRPKDVSVEYSSDMIYQDQQNGDAAPAIKRGDSATGEVTPASSCLPQGFSTLLSTEFIFYNSIDSRQSSRTAAFRAFWIEMVGTIIESLT